VIENITYPFLRPSILDVKLGTVTHEEDATEEKKARMIAAAKKSTSFDTGLRLTGFQVSIAAGYRPWKT
jgi:1D-myo-inositol-tetrakisphosphate 5-kinase/inositol-polyphosphate multikinase